MLKRRFKLIKQGLDDGAELSDLNDVSASSATNGQTIIWNGSAWVPGDISDIAGYTPATFLRGATFVGNGSALTTSVPICFVPVPVACTIMEVRLYANVAGNAVVDIWKDTHPNFPPTVAGTITAAAKPTLSAAASYRDTTLTGWSKALAAGDVLAFKLDSVATIQQLTCALILEPT